MNSIKTIGVGEGEGMGHLQLHSFPCQTLFGLVLLLTGELFKEMNLIVEKFLLQLSWSVYFPGGASLLYVGNRRDSSPPIWKPANHSSLASLIKPHKLPQFPPMVKSFTQLVLHLSGRLQAVLLSGFWAPCQILLA